VFEEYYLQKFGGRKLTWHSSMETCTLRAQFPSAAKELQVSVHQATVLLLFNTTDSLSFQQIRSVCSLKPPELNRTLQSLAVGKVPFYLRLVFAIPRLFVELPVNCVSRFPFRNVFDRCHCRTARTWAYLCCFMRNGDPVSIQHLQLRVRIRMFIVDL
jgi:hypothetical protein